MKRLLIFIACLAAGNSIYSQYSFTDINRLKEKLALLKNDSTKVSTLNDLARAYLNNSLDSTYHFINLAKALANHVGYEAGYYRAINIEALANRDAGDDATALRQFQLVLKRFVSIGNTNGTAVLQFDIAQTLVKDDNYAEAYPYLSNAIKSFRKEDPTHTLGYALHAMSQLYTYRKQYDSARVCLVDAVQHSKLDGLPLVIADLAENFRFAKDFFMANAGYDSARKYAIMSGNKSTIAAIDLGRAKTKAMQGLTDTAIDFAADAFNGFASVKDPNGMIKGADLLQALYNGDSGVCVKMNKDSAVKYLRLSRHIIETVYSQSAARKDLAQYMKIKADNEKERLEQIEAAHKRTSQLEIAGIAAFIPMFFGLIFWLGKIKIRNSILMFMAALSLIFFFEFITLLLHPLFGHWTGESPLLMFLLLVLVASFLVPIHHISQEWLFAKLEQGENADVLPDKEKSRLDETQPS